MRNVLVCFAIPALALVNLGHAAAPPERINYQGVLRNNLDEPLGIASPVVVAMTFRLFDSPTGGDAILIDTHPGVTIAGGLFNVELGGGSITDGDGPGTFVSLAAAFNSYSGLYLEVVVEGETLSPRTPIAAAGFALNAGRVNGIDVVADGPVDVYVDGTSGDDANDGRSPARAKRTIQAGVDAVPIILGGPATVHVAAGTYNESVLVTRTQMRGDEIALIAIEGAGTPVWPPVPSVILDGEGTRPTGITVIGFAEIRHIDVTGFTEAGFSAAFGYLRIDDCRIESNGVENGIGVFKSELWLVDTVVGNGTGEGPAIESQDANLILGRTELTADGAAVILIGSSSLWIEDELPGPVTINPGGVAIEASNSAANLESRSDICLGSMWAADHSTISGYGNDPCAGVCTTGELSICRP